MSGKLYTNNMHHNNLNHIIISRNRSKTRDHRIQQGGHVSSISFFEIWNITDGSKIYVTIRPCTNFA